MSEVRFVSENEAWGSAPMSEFSAKTQREVYDVLGELLCDIMVTEQTKYIEDKVAVVHVNEHISVRVPFVVAEDVQAL